MLIVALLIVLVIVDIVYTRRQNYQAMFYTSLSLTAAWAIIAISDFLTGHPIVGAIMLLGVIYFGMRTFKLKQYR